MNQQQKNKALVLEALETALNKKDITAYERYWSPDYIQHSAYIEKGREGLIKFMTSTPPDMRYEPGLIVAEGDYVMVHGRYSNMGLPKNLITVEILRIENGLIIEHWDVIQDEASQSESKSGLPMFGKSFGSI